MKHCPQFPKQRALEFIPLLNSPLCLIDQQSCASPKVIALLSVAKQLKRGGTRAEQQEGETMAKSSPRREGEGEEEDPAGFMVQRMTLCRVSWRESSLYASYW